MHSEHAHPWTSRGLALVASLLVFATASVAAAQEAAGADPSDEVVDAASMDEAARVLFELGTQHYEAGDFAEALPKYESAFELSGRSLLLYNIAVCHDRLDHKSDAAEYYERFATAVPNSQRAPLARSRASVLRESMTADAARAENLAALESELNARNDAEANAAAAETSSRSLVGPITAFAIGGAGLITFAVSGGIALSRRGALEDDCADGACDDAENSAADAVDRAALIADIGLGVAIAGTAVGVILLLVNSGGDEEHSATTQLVPSLSQNGGGVSVLGSF